METIAPIIETFDAMVGSLAADAGNRMSFLFPLVILTSFTFAAFVAAVRQDFFFTQWIVEAFYALCFTLAIWWHAPRWMAWLLSLAGYVAGVEDITSSSLLVWFELTNELAATAYTTISHNSIVSWVTGGALNFSPFAFIMWLVIWAIGMFGFYFFLSPYMTLFGGVILLAATGPAIFWNKLAYLPVNAMAMLISATIHMALLLVFVRAPLTAIEFTMDGDVPTAAAVSGWIYMLVFAFAGILTSSRIAAAMFHGSATRGDHLLGAAISRGFSWVRNR